MIEESRKGFINDKIRISIADAMMNKDNDTLRIKTTLPVTGNEVRKLQDGWNEVAVKMPAEPERGKPVSVVLGYK